MINKLIPARYQYIADKDQYGSVVIEFILVAPLFLFLLGYALRLTQILQANQIAMTISREAATEVFRKCTDYTILSPTCSGESEICIDETATKSATQACISAIQTKYTNQWAIARPAASPSNQTATISLDVYRHGLTSFSLPTNCASNSDPVTLITATSSTTATPPISSKSICQKNRIARGRISFTLRPVVAFLNLLPGFTNSDLTITDETIL
jgi:Flp pilus assembly protein TadG